MKFTNNSVAIRFLCRFAHCCLGATILSLALLAVGALTPRKFGNYSRHNCNVKICVSNTGIHSNIIVPTKNNIFDWHRSLSVDAIGKDKVKDYKYLSFGWGDRDFYMSTPTLSQMKFSTTFNALFIPTPTVLYVKGYDLMPNDVEVKCVKVHPDDYLRLVGFIQDTFQLDKNGRKVSVGKGHTPNAGFYSAKGSYSILRNCNSWAGEGLRKADINTPLWDGISQAIMWHLRSGCEGN